MVSVAERKWILGLAGLILALTTIPYLLGYYFQSESYRYSGFIFGVEDGNSYIAKMLSGANGAWLFRTPYTSYPQTGAIAFLPYILLGKLTAPPEQHVQLVIWFHLYRWVAGLLCALAIYDFAAIFLTNPNHRRLCVLLALCGGGLGFLIVFGLRFAGEQGLPLEFYSPETFGFLSILGLPHLAAGRAFLLWGIAGYATMDEKRFDWRRGMKIGGLWTLVGLMQPLFVILGWVVLISALGLEIAYSFIIHRSKKFGFTEQWKYKIKTIILAIIISSPIPIYSGMAYLFDPFIGAWMGQNMVLSPPPVDYLMAFILVLPFSIAGLIHLVKTQSKPAWILVGWVMIFPFLVYAPHNLQRRFPEGIWVVLSILAVSALTIPGVKFWKRFKPVLYTTFISSFVLFAGLLMEVSKPGTPLYRPAGEIAVFEHFAENASGRVVLARYDISNALPAWAYVRTVIGHGVESVRLKEIQPWVENLLGGTLSPIEFIDLVNELDVDYVLVAPGDSGDRLGIYTSLQPVYNQSGYRVFKVHREGE